MACCNVFSLFRLVLVLAVLIVFAGGLVLPWYQVHSETKTDAYHASCNTFYQAFYYYTNCHCDVFNQDCDTWLNNRADSGFHWWRDWSDVQYRRIVYLSLWGGLALCAFCLLLQLWSSHPSISCFVILLALATAASFFTLPAAYRADIKHCSSGPCDSLIGTSHQHEAKEHWNPWYGWTAPIAAVPLLLFLALFACCERRAQSKYTDIESKVVYVTSPQWTVAQRTPLSSGASLPSYSAVPTN
jgi:hypothetical protein